MTASSPKCWMRLFLWFSNTVSDAGLKSIVFFSASFQCSFQFGILCSFFCCTFGFNRVEIFLFLLYFDKSCELLLFPHKDRNSLLHIGNSFMISPLYYILVIERFLTTYCYVSSNEDFMAILWFVGIFSSYTRWVVEAFLATVKLWGFLSAVEP